MSRHLRLVLSHMHVGDHISFVAADAEGEYLPVVLLSS